MFDYCIRVVSNKTSQNLNIHCREASLAGENCSQASTYVYMYRWPKKVSHYHESSLNRIKTRH